MSYITVTYMYIYKLHCIYKTPFEFGKLFKFRFTQVIFGLLFYAIYTEGCIESDMYECKTIPFCTKYKQ